MFDSVRSLSKDQGEGKGLSQEPVSIKHGYTGTRVYGDAGMRV